MGTRASVFNAGTPLLAVVRSLSFSGNDADGLQGLSNATWRNLLSLTDRAQLTLPLGLRQSGQLPEWVRGRIDLDLAHNALRHERALQAYQEVQSALARRGLPFMVLKGFTHWPFYCDDLHARPQYDLDLYCPASDIEAAYQAVIELGYEPFRQKAGMPLDHLSPLIRKTGWRPRNDYFDPDMPLTVELHFRFWDGATECFDVHGMETFWERRGVRNIGGMEVPALDPTDALSYSAWHLVRHLLRGDLKAYHVYELAHFLQRTADHNDFWREWRAPRREPVAEAMAFRLATDWFGCRVNPLARELVQSLPSPVDRWFTMFGFSPLRALERPNKDELFLHLAIVKGFHDRVKIAKRRLLPFRFNPVLVDAHVPSPGTALRWKRRILGAWFMATRTWHHLRTVLPVIRNVVRWRIALSSPHKPRVGTVPR